MRVDFWRIYGFYKSTKSIYYVHFTHTDNSLGILIVVNFLAAVSSSSTSKIYFVQCVDGLNMDWEITIALSTHKTLIAFFMKSSLAINSISLISHIAHLTLLIDFPSRWCCFDFVKVEFLCIEISSLIIPYLFQ